MKTKLLLGSGNWHWSEYITVDSDPANEPDVIAVLPPLPPEVYRKEQFEEVLMVHAIEHIAPWLALELCKQVHEVLQTGGVFILEQPNIKYAAAVLLEQITPPPEEFPGQYDMAAFYGDPSHQNEWMLHRWGYYPASLHNMLIQAGFEHNRIVVKPTVYHGARERDFRVEAYK